MKKGVVTGVCHNDTHIAPGLKRVLLLLPTRILYMSERIT